MNRKFIDLTGQKFSRLTVLERDTSHEKGSWWVCQCDCGKKLSVRADALKSGGTKSCGCLRYDTVREGNKHVKDITGQLFGELEAVRCVGREGRGAVWECLCHRCGRTVTLPYGRFRRYTSCGCKALENKMANVDKTHRVYEESESNYAILRTEPNKNNRTTGVRGVWYIKSTGKYEAAIQYKKKKYKLLVSTDLKKCIAVRKEAERAVHEDFLGWLEGFRQRQNQANGQDGAEAPS